MPHQSSQRRVFFQRISTNPAFRSLCVSVLTTKQLEAVAFVLAGKGLRQIARELGISNPSVNDRLAHAQANVEKAMNR